MKKIFFLFLCFSGVSGHAQHTGKLYAVLAGVSEYRQSENNLTYSHQDAVEMYNLLKQQTDTSRLKLLVNRQATKAGIVDAMNRLFLQTGEDDVVIFFFSGHGNKGMFFAHDTPVTFQDLSAVFKKCRASRKLIFADACLSGTFRQSGTGQPAAHGNEMDDKRVLLFLSSRSDQNSKESLSLKNGAFTFFLAAGLRGGADANRDKKITARELFNFVSPRVKKHTAETQAPVMWGKFEDNMVILNWNKNR
jgi:uncharacterized caspase-like protein